MTGRDPATAARTIAAAYLAAMPDIDLVELQDLDADVPLSLPDTLRAELRALAERLALALHPDTDIEWNDPWSAPARRLITPWQPTPPHPEYCHICDGPCRDESEEDTR